MAFVLEPTLKVVFTFRDNDGKHATSEVLVPNSTTPANLVTFATALRPLLGNLSDAVIVGMNLIIGYMENAIPTIPMSDIENKGFVLFNGGNGLKSSITIPSILETALQGNNQDIDQSNTDIDDFLTAMTAGLSGVIPCNASGADLVSVKEAYKQNRRSHVSGRQRKG